MTMSSKIPKPSALGNIESITLSGQVFKVGNETPVIKRGDSASASFNKLKDAINKGAFKILNSTEEDNGKNDKQK